MTRKISLLGALLALALVASPVFAACGPEAHALAIPDINNDVENDIDAPAAMVPDNERAGVPDRLVGQILALDAERGQVLLGTDAGAIALRGAPGDLVGLEIGDVIEVVLMDEPEERPQQRI